jgi:hypothetical protein
MTDEFGNPVDAGYLVSFETTRGSFESNTAYTDSTGQCYANLVSDMSQGLAVVRAISGTVNAQTEVWFSATTVGRVLLTTEKNVVNVGIDRNVPVTALVLDAIGNRVTDRTSVSFTTTLGEIIPPNALTEDGFAYTYYTPRTITGMDTIIARSGSSADTAYILVQAGLTSTINLVAVPDTIASDGRSRSRITAELFDFYGNRVPSGRAVSFTTTLGNISASASTDSTGTARTTLTSGRETGTAMVQARCESGIGSVDVEFVNSEVAFISINADPRKIVANGISTSVITARLLDERAEPVTNGTVVVFHSTDELTGLPLGELDTIAATIGGVATVTLRSEPRLGTALVSASIWVYQTL